MRTGWIRLGVVLSATWLLGSSFFAYQGLSDLYGDRLYKLQHADGRVARIAFSKADTRDENSITREYAPLIEANPQKYLGNTVTDPYDRYLERHTWRTWRKYAAIAVLPPLLLMLGGWAANWIRQGFGESPGSRASASPALGLAASAVQVAAHPVPWRTALHVWWSFCWRGVAYAIAPVLLVAFAAGIWAANSGGTADDAGMVGSIAGYVLGLAASVPAMRAALRTHLKSLSQIES